MKHCSVETGQNVVLFVVQWRVAGVVSSRMMWVCTVECGLCEQCSVEMGRKVLVLCSDEYPEWCEGGWYECSVDCVRERSKAL